jgi:hypothetical protein
MHGPPSQAQLRRLRLPRPAWIAGSVFAVGAALLYGTGPVYDMAPATAFHGGVLFNPYAGADDASLHWFKVNLHGHTRAWGGLTNGRGTARQMDSAYEKLGYNLAAITNYMRIDGGERSMAAYENGFNASKSHILVLGATATDWRDVPVFESRNLKQERIDRLSRPGVVTIIAHPSMRHGFTLDDMATLSGYTAIEVLSHFAKSEREWDAALTAGRPVWAVGDDDSHDPRSVLSTGRAWTLVHSPTARAQDVLDAVAAGRTVAMAGAHATGYAWLERLSVSGDTITVQLRGTPSRITFVGAHGKELAPPELGTSARLVLGANEPYARVVVRTASTLMLLNPVMRTVDGRVTQPAARVNAAWTSARRSAVAIFVVLIFLNGLGAVRVKAAARSRASDEGSVVVTA